MPRGHNPGTLQGTRFSLRFQAIGGCVPACPMSSEATWAQAPSAGPRGTSPRGKSHHHEEERSLVITPDGSRTTPAQTWKAGNHP